MVSSRDADGLALFVHKVAVAVAGEHVHGGVRVNDPRSQRNSEPSLQDGSEGYRVVLHFRSEYVLAKLVRLAGLAQCS